MFSQFSVLVKMYNANLIYLCNDIKLYYGHVSFNQAS